MGTLAFLAVDPTLWLLPETWKVLISALTGGFVAVAITEPFKQWLSNIRKLREMRRNIYAEMAYNLTALHGLFSLAEGAHKQAGMTINLNACAKNTFKTVRYEAGKDNAFLFYRLEEADWFDHNYLMFRKMETEDVAYEIRVSFLGGVLAEALNYIDEKPKRKNLMAKVSSSEFKEIQTQWPRHKWPYDSLPAKP